MSTENRTQPRADHSVEELDDLFSVLADWRRRVVVDYLSRRQEASVSAIAECLAADEEECSAFEAEIALLHDQLPLLAQAGAIEFDREARRCRLADTARTETLVRLLTLAREAT